MRKKPRPSQFGRDIYDQAVKNYLAVGKLVPAVVARTRKPDTVIAIDVRDFFKTPEAKQKLPQAVARMIVAYDAKYVAIVTEVWVRKAPDYARSTEAVSVLVLRDDHWNESWLGVIQRTPKGMVILDQDVVIQRPNWTDIFSSIYLIADELKRGTGL